MSYFHIGLIIATVAILKVSPQNVVVSPNHIITDVGAESVTFTCNVDLDPASEISKYWITWKRRRCTFFYGYDETKLAHNDTVFDKDKYSLHGMSSIASNSITQNLTVHRTEEDDIGIYYCQLIIAGTSADRDYSYLILKNIISQVYCYDYGIKQEYRRLICSCYSGYPPITLQWIDKDGNVLAAEHQCYYTGGGFKCSLCKVKYTVHTASLYQDENFTCVATSSGSATTQQCIGTPIMSGKGNTYFSFTYNQSTVGVVETTEMLSIMSTNSNDESGNSYFALLTDKDTIIAILSVIGAISILANVAFLCYILTKNRKKTNKTEAGTKQYATCILSQVSSKQQKGVGIFKQEVGEDGYMEPIKVGEDGYMEPPAHIQDPYEQINNNAD
ncbi:uncharacterized protein LOC117102202 [Anneissia japonica]|uniref:uncharacterized protein LOC117102202 n=1 Tax=Anneissia japonica TaxID=1529436 RepID=UPI0014256C91|nr:uncharacterized protein LOC117102202 [Anneissia japonica]